MDPLAAPRPVPTAGSAAGSLQSLFASALLDPDHAGPAGLRAWNGSDPQRRLAVYRNNVVGSLVDAAADSFPVVLQLVGADFFRAMAAVHVRAEPPRSPVLALYGEGLADFIAGFAPAACLPYLADVARLEQARARAMHAADATPLGATAAGTALADPARVGELQLRWHPSAQLVRARHAAVSLWAAHQCDDEAETAARLAAVDTTSPEDALVLRPRLEVLVLPLAPGAADFIAASMGGAPLAAAAAVAQQAEPGFDPGATLAALIGHGALTALELPPTDLPPTRRTPS